MRRVMFSAAAAVVLLAAACGGSKARSPELRLSSEHYSFRISSEPMPPHAREGHRWKVVVLDRETRQPIQNGEGRIFATSRDGANVWDGLAQGPEVGTYYGTITFVAAGEWAVAIQFRRDSTQPLERVDWMQDVLAERGSSPQF